MAENIVHDWTYELPAPDFKECFSEEFIRVMGKVDEVNPITSDIEIPDKIDSLLSRLKTTFDDDYLFQEDYEEAKKEFETFGKAFSIIIHSDNNYAVFDDIQTASMAAKIMKPMRAFYERMTKEREGMEFNFEITPDEEME